AIITHAGGPAVMLTDQLQKEGLNVPELDKLTQKKLKEILYPGSSSLNPVDILATGNKEQVMSCIRICSELDYIDGIILIYGKTGMDNLSDTYLGVSQSMLECPKPVFPVLPSISSGAVEVAGFVALGHPVYFDEIMLGKCLGEVINEPVSYGAEPYFPAVKNGEETTTVLSEDQVLERLVSSGIPVVANRNLRNRKELEKLSEIQFPLVAKVMGILHKTEHNGVRLNIRNTQELEQAFSELMTIRGAKGVQIQEMLQGTELFLGAKRHPGIGWSVHAGPGGILVELLDDRVSSLAPVKPEEAKAMLMKLKARKLFLGFRNLPPVDIDAFAKLIADFSSLFARYPDIMEIDLNPLIASESRICVVDARIITDGSQY
ncbi:MAG: acetate--CoA ligase family protein, partial [Bacteroidales bacterium]|nr:acetate--CoA ligase family protein [Bacteroidales bacterium]